jgi:hypothetical protein
MRGFVKDYTMWIHHGETVVNVDPAEKEVETLITWTNM